MTLVLQAKVKNPHKFKYKTFIGHKPIGDEDMGKPKLKIANLKPSGKTGVPGTFKDPNKSTVENLLKKKKKQKVSSSVIKNKY